SFLDPKGQCSFSMTNTLYYNKYFDKKLFKVAKSAYYYRNQAQIHQDLFSSLRSDLRFNLFFWDDSKKSQMLFYKSKIMFCFNNQKEIIFESSPEGGVLRATVTLERDLPFVDHIYNSLSKAILPNE